jgi:hypothetical protein
MCYNVIFHLSLTTYELYQSEKSLKIDLKCFWLLSAVIHYIQHHQLVANNQFLITVFSTFLIKVHKLYPSEKSLELVVAAR